MAKRQLILNDQDIAALRRAAGQTDDPAELKRLQAIRLFGTGHPVAEIAEVVDSSIPSIYRWSMEYQQEGLRALETKYEGNQNAAKMTRAQKADLREKLNQYRPDQVLSPQIRASRGEFWTISDLQIAVKQWYGVTYQSKTSYRNLFHESDFSVQRTTGQYRSRASQEEIADFEEQLEKK
jgi:transposase